MIYKTCAKINLSLAIVGKKDNLHDLDMIFYPVENLVDSVEIVYDDSKYLTIEKIETSLLDFDEEKFIPFLNNKLNLINNYFNVGGKVAITKDVPLGAGIGGSSTVLASIVKSLVEKTNKKANIEFLLSLGSDVPYMMIGGPCRVQGVGDKLTPLQNENIDFDIKFVDGGVDTKGCYKLFDETCSITLDNIPTSINEAINLLRNDLFVPACKINPLIKTEYDLLISKGKRVVMTGSGSALVIIK